MRKNNISLILFFLLAVSSQISICTESQGWSYPLSSAMQSITSYIENAPQFMYSLSDKTKVILLATLVGAAGLYYVLYRKMTTQSHKIISKDSEIKLSTSSSTESADEIIYVEDTLENQSVEENEKQEETTSHQNAIEDDTQKTDNNNVIQDKEIKDNKQTPAPVAPNQISKSSSDVSSSLSLSSTSMAMKLLYLQTKTITINVQLHNGTSQTLQYTKNGNNVSVAVGPRNSLPHFAQVQLVYLGNILSSVNFFDYSHNFSEIKTPISSIEINEKSKLLSNNDIDYFKAIVRDKLPTLEDAQNCKLIQITLCNEGPSNWTESPIMMASFTISPQSKSTAQKQIDYLYNQLKSESGNGIILPLKLRNDYAYPIIYSTESIQNGSIDAASCDDSTSKTIAGEFTHETFGTALLQKNNVKNPNEIMNIVLQHYGNNKKIETLCVKTHTKLASYTALYGKLRLCVMNLLNASENNNKNILNDINEQSGHYLQINLAPQPRTLWVQNSLAPFEGSLDLYDKNNNMICSSQILW